MLQMIPEEGGDFPEKRAIIERRVFPTKSQRKPRRRMIVFLLGSRIDENSCKKWIYK
jgi:hypothetical protein